MPSARRCSVRSSKLEKSGVSLRGRTLGDYRTIGSRQPDSEPPGNCQAFARRKNSQHAYLGARNSTYPANSASVTQAPAFPSIPFAKPVPA